MNTSPDFRAESLLNFQRRSKRAIGLAVACADEHDIVAQTEAIWCEVSDLMASTRQSHACLGQGGLVAVFHFEKLLSTGSVRNLNFQVS